MLFHRPEKRIVELTPWEVRYARYALTQWYNKLIAQGKPTEDVAALLVMLSK